MQNVSGFLLIDKPLHYTSFDVIRDVRKYFQIKKVGHTGTLDPLATGLMCIGIGQATRFLEFHVGHTKEYIAEITFGAVSETYDAEGPVCVSENKKQIIKGDIEAVLDMFRGEIEQIPPKYSALKINGQKLCNLVRAGKEVDVSIKKRKVTLFKNEILEFDEESQKLKLCISCSSGTYIRSIAHDLGQVLECGAYLSALQRTKIDDFCLENAHKLSDLKKDFLLPFESGLDFPVLQIHAEQSKQLHYGQVLETSEFSVKFTEQYYQVFLDEEFHGVVEYKKGRVYPKKMTLV